MFKGGIFKVKEGKLEAWQAWCLELQNERQEEALETLVDEGLLQEAVVLAEVDGNHYVIGLMEGEGKEADMNKEINVLHKQKKEECLEKVSKVETLYHLKVF